MESYIKIKTSANRMNDEFSKSKSLYYYIKYFDGHDNYKGDNQEEIVFECMIRHNEIGNRTIERSAPYTFETLEKTLEKKCKEYEEEQKNIGMEM